MEYSTESIVDTAGEIITQSAAAAVKWVAPITGIILIIGLIIRILGVKGKW